MLDHVAGDLGRVEQGRVGLHQRLEIRVQERLVVVRRDLAVARLQVLAASRERRQERRQGASAAAASTSAAHPCVIVDQIHGRGKLTPAAVVEKVLLLLQQLLLLRVAEPLLVVVVIVVIAVLLVVMVVVVVVVGVVMVTGRVHGQVLGVVTATHAAVGRLQVQLAIAAPVTGRDRVRRRSPRP